MFKIYQTIVKILFKLTVYYLRGNVNVQFWNTLLKGRFIMSVYIITGGTTGIGAAVRTTLPVSYTHLTLPTILLV